MKPCPHDWPPHGTVRIFMGELMLYIVGAAERSLNWPLGQYEKRYLRMDVDLRPIIRDQLDFGITIAQKIQAVAIRLGLTNITLERYYL